MESEHRTLSDAYERPGVFSVVLPRRRRFTVVLPVLGLVLLALCGLLLFGLATARVGVLAVVVGVVAAVVPVGIAVPALLWVDRWEPEPAKLLLVTFLWGACVATLSALLINGTAGAIGEMLLGKVPGSRLSALVSAPIVEEAVKVVPVLAVLWRRARDFDGMVDGVVYAGFSAAGFAFTENIYYFGRAFAEFGFDDGGSSMLGVFIIRGLLSPFTHPLFTVITGIAIGYAATARSRVLRVVLPLTGYAIAVCLHALWNGSAMLGGAGAFLNMYFLVMVPIFVGVLLVVLWQRRREYGIIAAALPEMVRERWIASSEVDLLTSLSGRRRWRRAVRRQSGRRAARAVAAYQANVTALAFLRHGRTPARARVDPLSRQQELLGTLHASRTEAVRLAGSNVQRS